MKGEFFPLSLPVLLKLQSNCLRGSLVRAAISLRKTMSVNENITVSNKSENVPWLYNINTEDTNWIITSAFMIFTMQTG